MFKLLSSIFLLASFFVHASELSDPMRPDDGTGITAPGKQTGATTIKAPAKINLWVQSIQIGQGERTTTINGKLLKVGDKIGGAQLIAIEHDQVKLRKGRELIKLMFLPRAIKR